jgi:hypothetical protein
MSKKPEKNKKKTKKMTTEDYVRRFDAEAAAMKRAYCNIFSFWRTCPSKLCRRAQACVGDQNTCLKRGVHDVPRDVQWQARAQLIATAPASAGPPERTARECMPMAFFELEAQRERQRMSGR